MSRLSFSPTILAGVGLLILIMFLCNGPARADEKDLEKRLAQAREALNETEYLRAAELFEQARQMTDQRRELARIRYWEAYSRARLNKVREKKLALQLLKADEMRHAEAEILAQSETLAARIYGELAQRGEVEAMREIQERAEAEEIRTETRLAALQALMEMNHERAIPMLEKILTDRSPENRELRRHAVMLACHRRDPELQKMLQVMLESEDDPEFQAEIIMCLSRNPSEEFLEQLMTIYRSQPTGQVAEAVIMSLSHRSDREHAAKVKGFLMEIARDGKGDSEIRQHAIMALTHMDPHGDHVDLLFELATNEKDPEILEATLMSLAHMDSPAARKTLLALLNDPVMDEEFKAHALYALGHDGGMAVADLMKIYREAEGEELRLQVCHMLSINEDRDAALDAIIKIARNEKDLETRREMIYWLGRFEDDRAADFLLEVLEDK